MSRAVILLSLLAFFSVSSATSVVDFCVADFQFPIGPAGYPCRNPANLTADDFVYSGLGVAGDTSKDKYFKFATTPAFLSQFPALNGLGISIARLDIGVGGVVPIHAHRASEIILVVDGPILAGFIADDNTAFYKTLNRGDIMIFPASLLHFQVNIGDGPALAFVSLNSPTPGFQVTSTSLFSKNLPAEVIEKITLLDATQVQKLKELLGGCTNC